MRLKEFLRDGGDINSQWSNMNVSSRANYIKGDLLRRGYSQNQAAAILGNLLQENSTLNTNTQNTKSKALGIAQWLGSRKSNILAQGKHNTITGQLDFLDQEIKGNSEWTNNVGGKKAFFSTDNVEELTKVFRKDFERPGEHEANDRKRIQNAYGILGKPYTHSVDDYQTKNPDYYQGESQIGIPDNMSPNYEEMQQFILDNPGSSKYFNRSTQKEFEESLRLKNEKENQEYIQKKTEQENALLQSALEEKKAQRNQMLSMVPQSASITSGMQPSIPKLF